MLEHFELFSSILNLFPCFHNEDLQEHRAAAAREAREVQLRREAAARRRRLAAQREVRPEQKRNTSFGSCHLALAKYKRLS